MSTYVSVVISPETTTRPVLTSVSQATRPPGSSRRTASSTPSEIWSAILSGWPSVTDSEVNRYCLGGTAIRVSRFLSLSRETLMAVPPKQYLFTSESVTEGHPDKIADQISDGVLDAVLREDPGGRVACETLVNTGLVVVSGEITTDTYVDIPKIARETIKRIGYTDALYGFDCNTCAVINAIDKQS